LTPAEQGGQCALAPKAANDAFGWIGFDSIHAAMITKFSLSMQAHHTALCCQR
jgi:hypothetical protein